MILALDLGTTMGYATDKVSGSMSFSVKRNDHPAKRWIMFKEELSKLLDNQMITCVYYEDVAAHKGTRAAHVYGGFKAILEMICYTRNILIHGVPVGTIKKYWTGKGTATKEEMMNEAINKGHVPLDDNHADAIALYELAKAMER